MEDCPLGVPTTVLPGRVTSLPLVVLPRRHRPSSRLTQHKPVVEHDDLGRRYVVVVAMALIVGGAIFVGWWCRSLAAFSRSLHSYNKRLKALAVAAQRGATLPDANLTLWRVQTIKLTRSSNE